jgi:hypothetical protein
VGIVLPGYLVTPLGWIGLDYPNVDESALFAVADRWSGSSTEFAQLAVQVKSAGEQIAAMDATGSDAAVAAFEKWYTSSVGPAQRVTFDGLGDELMAAFCEIMALIVIALKIYFVYKCLELLYEVAAALASAIFSAGTSTATIPALIAAAQRYLSAAIEAAAATASDIKSHILSLLEVWFVKAALPQAAMSLGHLAGGAGLGAAVEEFGLGTLENFGKEAAKTAAEDFKKEFQSALKSSEPPAPTPSTPPPEATGLDHGGLDQTQGQWEEQIKTAEAQLQYAPDFDKAQHSLDILKYSYEAWKKEHGR